MIAMLLTLGLKIFHIDVAFLVTFYRNHPKSSHHGRSWIRPVRREGDETHVTLGLPSFPVIPSNC